MDSSARAANIAWDNGDMAEFDRISARELDRTIAGMTDAEIVALVTSSPIAAALLGVDHSHGASCTRPGRESAR